MSEQEMLALLERILDSPFEADKWRHEAELAYVRLGGSNQALIAPTLRGRIEARRAKAEGKSLIETVEQAYKRGQEEMRTVLAMCIEIGLGKEPADRMRAIETFPYKQSATTEKGEEAL